VEPSTAFFLLTLSLLLQSWVVLLAFRLIPLTGYRLPWILLATAILIHLFHLLVQLPFTSSSELNLAEEVISLATSGLLAAGIYLLPPIFFQHRRAVEERDIALARLKKESAAAESGRRTLERFMEQQDRLLAELEGVIHSIADGVILYGPEGEVRRRNPAAELLFGYTEEHWNKPLKERRICKYTREPHGMPLPPDELPVARALRGEVVRSVIISHSLPDGNTIWLSASAAPIRLADGRTIGAVGTYANITSLHATEERLRDFQHMIAHDLRIPLAIILGHAQMLKPEIEKFFTDEVPRLNILSILHAGSQMKGMMEDLVDMARTENGGITLQLEWVDLREFLPEFLERNRVSMDVGRISLDLPEELPPVLADPLRLERIMGNLLSNALKYSSPEASILLGLQLHGEEVLFSIADEGKGIAPEELSRIFDLFYRSGWERQQRDGLGLGLFITRTLVEGHGGRLWAESTIGKGSTFYFTLRADAATSPRNFGIAEAALFAVASSLPSKADPHPKKENVF